MSLQDLAPAISADSTLTVVEGGSPGQELTTKHALVKPSKDYSHDGAKARTSQRK